MSNQDNMNGSGETFLTKLTNCLSIFTNILIRNFEKQIYEELGTENPFVLGLSEVDLENWIDHKLCCLLALTADQIETAEEENQNKKSYLSKLPDFCLENICNKLHNDANDVLQSVFDKWQRLKKVRARQDGTSD